jgi:hypothetical protein
MAQTTTTLDALRAPTPAIPDARAGFDTVAGFELIQRTAKLFAASDIVPKQYHGNIANCVIAVDIALRMGANPLMVMQSLYVVHGRPSWSAQFLIATLNQCGRFSVIRYEFQGKEGADAWGCRAVSTELSTGEKLTGPLVTIGLAKKEGWYDKSGSKWPTMPEVMLATAPRPGLSAPMRRKSLWACKRLRRSKTTTIWHRWRTALTQSSLRR